MSVTSGSVIVSFMFPPQEVYFPMRASWTRDSAVVGRCGGRFPCLVIESSAAYIFGSAIPESADVAVACRRIEHISDEAPPNNPASSARVLAAQAVMSARLSSA
jgi:hypothetical protein